MRKWIIDFYRFINNNSRFYNQILLTALLKCFKTELKCHVDTLKTSQTRVLGAPNQNCDFCCSYRLKILHDKHFLMFRYDFFNLKWFLWTNLYFFVQNKFILVVSINFIRRAFKAWVLKNPVTRAPENGSAQFATDTKFPSIISQHFLRIMPENPQMMYVQW